MYQPFFWLTSAGLPAGVDPAFLKMTLPTIRGDYEVFETYDVADFGAAKVECPMAVFFAKDDVSVAPHEIESWIDWAATAYETVEFAEGSHFYLTEAQHKDSFTEKLLEVCSDF